MNIETLLSIQAYGTSEAPKKQDLSARGCRGPNCGRKGRKAGAVPLRSYTTKQETDNLNSKALKVKKNKRARRRY